MSKIVDGSGALHVLVKVSVHFGENFSLKFSARYINAESQFLATGKRQIHVYKLREMNDDYNFLSETHGKEQNHK